MFYYPVILARLLTISSSTAIPLLSNSVYADSTTQSDKVGKDLVPDDNLRTLLAKASTSWDCSDSIRVGATADNLNKNDLAHIKYFINSQNLFSDDKDLFLKVTDLRGTEYLNNIQQFGLSSDNVITKGPADWSVFKGSGSGYLNND